MDNIEDLIRHNREELDKYTPPPEIWTRINKDLHRKRFVVIRWISAAAVIVLVFVSSILFYIGENRKNYLAGRTKPDGPSSMPDVRIKETEIYYNNLINDLYSKAKPFLTAHPDAEKELIDDLTQLDSICSDLKSDLKDNIDNKEVIEALIINYRIKIHILENILAIPDQDPITNETPVNYEL